MAFPSPLLSLCVHVCVCHLPTDCLCGPRWPATLSFAPGSFGQDFLPPRSSSPTHAEKRPRDSDSSASDAEEAEDAPRASVSAPASAVEGDEEAAARDDAGGDKGEETRVRRKAQRVAPKDMSEQIAKAQAELAEVESGACVWDSGRLWLAGWLL